MKGVQVMSIHIAAKVGDIAETVLLPGDSRKLFRRYFLLYRY